ECEGRGVETEGINKAADYVAEQFKKAGLKPGGVDGTWFQPFTRSGSRALGAANALALRGPLGQTIELKAGRDFVISGLARSGKVAAGIVFAGYGVVSEKAKYDDYQGLDVAGKVVVVLRKTPRAEAKDAPFTDDEDYQNVAPFVSKLAAAVAHK